MLREEIDYDRFLFNSKNGPLFIDRNQSLDELICDRCGRKIKNYYSKIYALRDDNICSYCTYDDIIQNVKDSISENKKLKMNNCKSEEYTDEMEYIRNTYENLEFFHKASNKEGVSDYNEADSIEINAIKIFSFCRKPLKLGFNSPIILGIKTNNNCAIVYAETYDPEFNHCYYQNPFIFYYFSKEIYEKFNDLIEFEDYLHKIIACEALKIWENSSNYESEILKLKEEIRKKFNYKFEISNYFYSYKHQYNYKVWDAIREELDTMLIAICDNYLYSKEEKITLIDETFDLMKSIKNGIYIYKGNKCDLRTMNIGYNSTILEQLNYSLDFGYQLHINKLYFEAWKVKGDNKYLLDCLRKIDSFLSFNYMNLPDNRIYNYQSDIEEINLLEKIIYSFVDFYNVNENSFQDLAINGTLPKLKGSLYPITGIPFIEPNEDGELTEEHLAIIGANIAEILRLVYLILILFEIRLEGRIYGNQIAYRVVKLVRTLKTQFMVPFQEYMSSIYKSRIKFENLNYDLINGIMFILNSFTEYISSIEILSVEDCKKIFEFKHTNLILEIPDELSEQIDCTVFKLIDVIVEKINFNKDEKYKLVQQKLKNELGNKYSAISESVFKTLSTGEYLFEIFGSDDDNLLDLDYSCISIMYYKALEDFLNYKIWIPYKNNYLRNFSYRYKKNNSFEYKASKSNRNNTIESIDNYLPIKNDQYYYRNGDIQNTLTLGTFHYFLNEISTLDKLNEFFKNILKADIDIESISSYSSQLGEVFHRRNNSAHGGKIISYDNLKEDKRNVYTYETSLGVNYKILIIKLIDLLK
jgi:hypothetical protein